MKLTLCTAAAILALFSIAMAQTQPPQPSSPDTPPTTNQQSPSGQLPSGQSPSVQSQPAPYPQDLSPRERLSFQDRMHYDYYGDAEGDEEDEGAAPPRHEL